MATYRLETIEKKSVEEREYFTKNDITICYVTGWRWGYYKFETDAPVEIDLDNKFGVDVNCLDYDYVDHTYSDGVYSDWEFPESVTEEEQEEIQNAFEEDYYDGLENLGWTQEDTEVWFHGPLQLTEEN